MNLRAPFHLLVPSNDYVSRVLLPFGIGTDKTFIEGDEPPGINFSSIASQEEIARTVFLGWDEKKGVKWIAFWDLFDTKGERIARVQKWYEFR
jgi:hypothetical protein